MSDGAFEARVVCRSALTQIIANASRYVKTPLSPEWVRGLRSLHVKSDRPLSMMADGEVYKNVVEVSFTMRQGILKIAVPEGRHLRKDNRSQANRIRLRERLRARAGAR